MDEMNRRYFDEAADIIASRNRYLFGRMMHLYLLCLVAYLLFVCLPQGIAAQTWAVAVAMIVHGAYMGAAWKPMHSKSVKVTEVLIILFGAEILLLTGWLGIAVFGEAPALLFPLMLILMTQIYNIRPTVEVPFVCGYALVFLMFSAAFKQPEVFIWDVIACAIAMAIGFVSYFTSLRYKADMFALQQNLRYMCSVDGMTGMLNKTTFEYCAGDFLRKKKGGSLFALAVIDLDHFKTINDMYGHKAGDESLLAFASILKNRFSSDESYFVGRFGGDEFVVLIKNAVSVEETRRTFEKLMDDLKSCSDMAFQVTCSIGASVSAREDVTFSQVFLEADRALYAAKEEGGAALCVSELGEHVAAAPLMLMTCGDETDASVLRACFSGDYRLVETSGNKETLDMIQRYRDGLSVIIADVGAPDMDGEAIVRQIRKMPEMSRVPIIALSDFQGEMTAPDVQGEIVKPVDADNAERVVRAALPKIRRERGAGNAG